MNERLNAFNIIHCSTEHLNAEDYFLLKVATTRESCAFSSNFLYIADAIRVVQKCRMSNNGLSKLPLTEQKTRSHTLHRYAQQESCLANDIHLNRQTPCRMRRLSNSTDRVWTGASYPLNSLGSELISFARQSARMRRMAFVPMHPLLVFVFPWAKLCWQLLHALVMRFRVESFHFRLSATLYRRDDIHCGGYDGQRKVCSY